MHESGSIPTVSRAHTPGQTLRAVPPGGELFPDATHAGFNTPLASSAAALASSFLDHTSGAATAIDE